MANLLVSAQAPAPAPSRARCLHSRALAALVISALVMTLAPYAHTQAKSSPDIIIFTNGDQLTGTTLRGVGDSIVFKSDMAGEITVSLSKIKELRAAGNFAVIKKGAPPTKAPVQAGVITVNEGSVTVSSSSAPQTIPDKDLAYIVDSATYAKEIAAHDSLLHGWNGAVSAGATLIRATQTGTSFNVGLSALRIFPTVPYLPKRSRSIFNLNEAYGKLTQPVIPPTVPATVDSVAKTNIFHTDFEHDKYFSPRFFVLGIVSFDHNFSQGLNLQQVYGGGIGWTPFQTAKQQLDLTANVHYEKQSFQVAASNQNLIGATIADAYIAHLPGKLVFTQTASFLPAFNNSNAYSANFTAGLALPVYHRLSVSFITSDNYLNNPAPFYKKNSYQYLTAITYAFK